MSPKEIIESILDVYNLNATEFAEKIDVQRSGVSHIMTGRNNPSLDFLIKIKEAFPRLSWDFLIYGKLPMYVTDNKNLEENSKIEISAHDKKVDEAPTLFDMKETDDFNEKKKTPILSHSSKKIDKIVIFYTDGTFKAYQESNSLT